MLVQLTITATSQPRTVGFVVSRSPLHHRARATQGDRRQEVLTTLTLKLWGALGHCFRGKGVQSEEMAQRLVGEPEFESSKLTRKLDKVV